MSKFQIILLVVFGAFIVLAVVLFSQSRGGGGAQVNLTVWGTLPGYDFSNMLTAGGLTQSESISFAYEEKKASTIGVEFTEALAVGRGPDLIILSADTILREKDKLILIPSDSVRQADFSNAFVKQGELFLTSLGAYALPMYVDPMVLYWNRDTLSKASLAVPPMYWDQIYSYITKLNTKDGAGNITQSALALGEARNIPHAKDILALLMLQAGTPITNYSGDRLRSSLLEGTGGAQLPAVAALEFYTQFANPQKSYFSWNRSQVSADTHFTSGKSAMYLGFASELPTLKAKNPTMDIGVAPVPQSRVSGKSITVGRLYGVAIARSAKDGAGALMGALTLVSKSSNLALSQVSSLVPVRRDILSEPPTDPAGFTFYGAALQSTGWLDPEPAETKKIFVEMIESVTSGRARVEEAVNTASGALNTLIEK